MLSFMTQCEDSMANVSITWDEDREDFSMMIERHQEGDSELLYSDSYQPIRPGPLRGIHRLSEILNKLDIRIPEIAFRRLQHWEATKPSVSDLAITQMETSTTKLSIALTWDRFIPIQTEN